MHRLLLSFVLVSGCVTPRPAGLPCDGTDAARCLEFVKVLDTAKQRDGEIAHALERHCLQGSLESCQALAGLRDDHSLQQLCSDGIAEACPIPAERRALEVLRGECEQGLPGACRTFFGRPDLREDVVSAATLERGCDEGLGRVCFALSKKLQASNATRAKELSWRSCLAGVEAACLESEVGATRCAKGNGPACRAFNLAFDDSPQLRARKLATLKQACANKLASACRELGDEEGLPHAELVQLACPEPATCPAALDVLSDDELLASCRDGAPALKDLACAEAVSRPRQVPDFVRAWAQTRCERSTGQCDPWLRLLELDERRLEVVRVRCRADACPDAESLQLVDRCLAGASGETCARAGLWLESLRLTHADELAVARKVLGAACAGKEALSCVAAVQLESDPLARLTLLEKACAAGSKRSCEDAQRLATAKKQCEQGACSAWVDEFTGDQLAPEVLALVVNTCAKGVDDDCLIWSRHVSISQKVEQCVRSEAFCPPYLRTPKKKGVAVPGLADLKVLRPKLVAAHGACAGGGAEGCSALLATMDELEGLTTTWRPEVDETVLGWAKRACDAGLACDRYLELLQATTPRPAGFEQLLVEVLDRECARGKGARCGDRARMLWSRAQSARGRGAELAHDTPELRRALALALEGCERGDASSCELAADFTESGIGGGTPDPLAAERLRARAKETR